MLMVVTGVAGFIGSHLADRLLGQGHRVVGVDNLSRGMRENLSEALGNPDFHFIEGDVSEPAALVGALTPHGPADVIWHLAANSDIAAGVSDFNVDVRRTYLTTVATLDVMRRIGVGVIRFASTSAVYGDLGDVAITEESGPLEPVSAYGAAKLASEALIRSCCESFVRRADIYRFPNVVGAPATHGVLLDFVRKLKATPENLSVLGNGGQQKPYLHVAELIEAMQFIAAQAAAPYLVVNIGPPDDGVTVRAIAEMVRDAVSPAAAITYGQGARGWVGDVPRFRYSGERLRALGWPGAGGSEAAVRRALGEIIVQEQAA